MDETVETRIYCIDVEIWRADPGHWWSGQAERTVQLTARQTAKGLVRQAEGDHRGGLDQMKINIHSGKHEEKYSQDQNLTVAGAGVYTYTAGGQWRGGVRADWQQEAGD